MADPPLFSEKELAFLRALREEGVEFLVVGLAAAALQGAPAVTQDIDLWFEDLGGPAFRRALSKTGVAYVAPTIQNPPLLAGSGADLFDIVVTMHGLGSFREELARAVSIEVGDMVLPVLPLERIIVSKKATARPKDLAILPVLQDALKSLEAINRGVRKGAGRSRPSRKKR